MPYKDREKYLAHLEKLKDRYHSDPEFREKCKIRSGRNYTTEKKHRQHINRTYGLSEEEFKRMEKEQKGLCKICGMPPQTTGRFKRLQVDHDHKTGRVRGLLCFQCNPRLGWFEKYRHAAEEYLK